MTGHSLPRSVMKLDQESVESRGDVHRLTPIRCGNQRLVVCKINDT